MQIYLELPHKLPCACRPAVGCAARQKQTSLWVAPLRRCSSRTASTATAMPLDDGVADHLRLSMLRPVRIVTVRVIISHRLQTAAWAWKDLTISREQL